MVPLAPWAAGALSPLAAAGVPAAVAAASARLARAIAGGGGAAAAAGFATTTTSSSSQAPLPDGRAPWRAVPLRRGPLAALGQQQRQQLRWHNAHAAVGGAAEGAEREDPATRVRKSIKDWASLPWDLSMPYDEAARVLGAWAGPSSAGLKSGEVLPLDQAAMTELLAETTLRGNKGLEAALFAHADSVTRAFFGDDVYYRGIVEFSNVCTNDCGYCGIRKHQKGITRYTMKEDEVVEVARWAFENRMGTLMLQSGELATNTRLAFLQRTVAACRDATVAMDIAARGLDPKDVTAEQREGMGLRVALSVGELPRDHYQALFDAGARRYLLRIETSNPDLYQALHPSTMSWEKRLECLNTLKEVGFQVGTGVMVGLPGQTLCDLAGDVAFFKEFGANMIGMGPYITEPGTPVTEMWQALHGHVDKKEHMMAMFHLTTRVNALARITIGGANITATTALQAIDPNGREVALRRGANVLMPILTPTKYRENYQLYEGKPCITDTADECRKCLNARVSMIGKRAKMGAWGDPPNFVAPVKSSVMDGAVSARGLHTLPALGRPRGLHTRAFSSAAQPAFATPAGPSGAKAAAGIAGSDVPRVNIGVFGVMNAGKSTLINALTRQARAARARGGGGETSIVDATPGTTADVKAALMELHDIGPAKLFDTAGVDEEGGLGEKKRRKALAALKESDVALIVVDCARHAAAALAGGAALGAGLRWERQLLEAAAKYGAVPLLVLNLKRGAWPPAALAAAAAAGGGGGGAGGVTDAEAAVAAALRRVLDPAGEAAWAALDLHGGAGPAPGGEFGGDVPGRVAAFVQAGVAASRGRNSARALPEDVLGRGASVFLNIPMDAETPSMRLLRPQALVQEEAIRHWATTTAYRMDLAAARGPDAAARDAERDRFLRALAPLLAHDGPRLLAIDVVHPWTLDPSTGAPLLPITTFSIAMAHRQSGGRLGLFVDGLRSMIATSGGAPLAASDRVLVAEACNHNRITSDCNDIGMVQLPNKLRALVGGEGPVIEHAFGREYPDLEEGGLGRFRLALHCGGCMIDAQKMRARLMDMEEAGVPVTNYGLFLSYVHDPAALARCLEPWGHSL
ncbi:MAG: hypothetical protein J3K34DRAFT_518152 [Monoraphidium minutum]|nr:MAG: hypothetical protein J3K34DRAFT_518152 [Monoraphidium minutum]